MAATGGTPLRSTWNSSGGGLFERHRQASVAHVPVFFAVRQSGIGGRHGSDEFLHLGGERLPYLARVFDGYRHASAQLDVVPLSTLKLILERRRHQLEQLLDRSVQVVKLVGEALQPGHTALPLAVVDAFVVERDLPQLSTCFGSEDYVSRLVHFVPVRRIVAAKWHRSRSTRSTSRPRECSRWLLSEK